MNKKQLVRMGQTYARIRLRPRPIRLNPRTRKLLSPRDDTWIMEPSPSKESIRLKNVRTDHFLVLGVDHVREFRTAPSDPATRASGYLLLKCVLILTPSRIYVEPIGNIG